jgi:hypothetical protein
VRISDISVSRVHSKIFLQDNKLYLEDCGSKFGTLVLAKEQVEINDSSKVIQIGRTLISTFVSNKNNEYYIKINLRIVNASEVKIGVSENHFNGTKLDQG